jgi:hypothetical protein
MNLLKVRVQAAENAAAVLYRRIVAMRDDSGRYRRPRMKTGNAAADAFFNFESPWLVAGGPSGSRSWRKAGKTTAPLTIENIAKLPQEIQAVVWILIEHVQDKPFSKAPADIVLKALNRRVAALGNSSQARLRPPWFLLASGPIERFIAESLLAYLCHFAEEPRLVHHKPLAICDNCRGLFLKRKTNQKQCSDKCRFDSWRRAKAKEDPDYWKDKAAASRAVRKVQKRARQKQV